jgi:serine kinase of HPr protein (carbohydrate metabolism regulator)
MPVAPGRNLALLIEVAARTQLLKERGVDSARRFVERFDALIEAEAQPDAPRAPLKRPRRVARRRR